MGLTPDFDILSEEGLFSLVKNRLISLKVVDEAGFNSDSVEVVLSDRDNDLALPKLGSKIQVFLGYKQKALNTMGVYTVNEVAVEGPLHTLVIKGHAADLNSSLKSPRFDNHSWQTIGDLVEKIATKHGYKPRVSPELAVITIPHFGQTAESDMHLLTRLGNLYGAVAKFASGYLLFMPGRKARSFSGQQLNSEILTMEDICRFRLSFFARLQYSSVVAHSYDLNAAKTIEEKAGEGEPSLVLRGLYPNATLAKEAATAKLKHLQASSISLNVTLPGRETLLAESKIILRGFKKDIPDKWLITKSIHTLDTRGYQTEFDAVCDL